MKQVKLTPRNNASLRTKNRIKSNGPAFILEKTVMNVLTFEHEAFFLKSETTNWCGWLTLNEVEMEYINEN